MTVSPDFCRLPFRSHVETALQECLALPESTWAAHFNTGYHNGHWHACALRGSTASPLDIAPGEGGVETYTDLPLLQALPSVQALLASIPCAMKSVRLMRLGAGGVIREHRDAGVGLAFGEARLHLPLQTDPDVFFYVGGARVPLRAGEWWYLDVSRPHRVLNRGHADRIHLVVDCVVDAWLIDTLSTADQGDPMPTGSDPQARFQAFREQVFRNPQWQEALLAITDPEAFDQEVVAMGRAVGLDFSTEDVHSARNQGRRSWIEQWII